MSPAQQFKSVSALIISFVLTGGLHAQNVTSPERSSGCSTQPGYASDSICEVPDGLPGQFAPPSPGESYTDPNFGATVRALTGPTHRHMYSTPSALSATNKYAFVFNTVGTLSVVNVATAQVAYTSLEGSMSNGHYWDSDDDEVYYWVAGSAIKKHDLRTRETTIVADYATNGFGFTSIETGGTGDSSKENWIAFWAPANQQVCAANLRSGDTYCTSYANVPGPEPTFIDYALMAKGVDRTTGKRYLVMPAAPSMYVFSLDLSAGKLNFEYRGPENPEMNGNRNGICDAGEVCLSTPHADVMEDSNGIQYLVATAEFSEPCEQTLATYRLNAGNEINVPVAQGGGLTKVMTLFKCGTYWAGEHIGCSKKSGNCVISIHNVKRAPGDVSPVATTPNAGQVFLMRENGAEIRRLAMHRSFLLDGEEADSYWSMPRASISNDGGLVVLDSNFGVLNQQRVLCVSTGVN